MSETQKKDQKKPEQKKPVVKKKAVDEGIIIKDGKAYEGVSKDELDRRIDVAKNRINEMQKNIENIQERKAAKEAELASLEAIKTQIS